MAETLSKTDMTGQKMQSMCDASMDANTAIYEFKKINV